MAERFGVSRATYDRVRYILSNGTEEMIESLRRGYVEEEDTKSKHRPIGIRTATRNFVTKSSKVNLVLLAVVIQHIR